MERSVQRGMSDVLHELHLLLYPSNARSAPSHASANIASLLSTSRYFQEWFQATDGQMSGQRTRHLIVNLFVMVQAASSCTMNPSQRWLAVDNCYAEQLKDTLFIVPQLLSDALVA
jgi:hypothetical protein